MAYMQVNTAVSGLKHKLQTPDQSDYRGSSTKVVEFSYTALHVFYKLINVQVVKLELE